MGSRGGQRTTGLRQHGQGEDEACMSRDEQDEAAWAMVGWSENDVVLKKLVLSREL